MTELEMLREWNRRTTAFLKDLDNYTNLALAQYEAEYLLRQEQKERMFYGIYDIYPNKGELNHVNSNRS